MSGNNPAARMEGDWWRNWAPEYGFQKAVWHADYLRHRGTISKTRKKIEEIVAGLSEVRVLETNIEARASMKTSAYPRPFTDPFDLLLRTCRPAVVIAYGKHAVSHIQARRHTFKLIECKHLIYVGRARTEQIIEETRLVLETLPARSA